LIDLTAVADADLVPYLEAVGAGAAAPYLRARSQRVLAARDTGRLPEGARVLPLEYGVRSEHQVGFVLVAAWAF
jgi:hypothetical protein